MDFDVSQFYFKADEPERRLWRAVVSQAIRDFRKIAEAGDKLDSQADSAYFLFSTSNGWQQHRHSVLHNAGLDPAYFDLRLSRSYLKAKYDRLLALGII